MPLNADDFAIDLERAPECARRIGLILGLFVQVEHGLVPILSWCAGMPMDQARVSLELQKQNARKMSFLRSICEGISPGWPRDIAAGKAFATAAMTANRIRNKYAHASYSLMAEAEAEKLYVAVFSDDLRNAARIEIATLETLETEIRFLKSLIVAMQNYAEARSADTPINRQEIEELVSTAPKPFLRTP